MLKEQIEQDLVASLKARDTKKLSALRLLKARIQQEQIAKGGQIADADVLNLIKSQVKRHKEAAEGFQKAGRQESYDEEISQSEVLSAYLPPQLSEQEITEKLQSLISTNSWTSKDFGMAMKQAKNELGDAADGSTISEILKKLLANS